MPLGVVGDPRKVCDIVGCIKDADRGRAMLLRVGGCWVKWLSMVLNEDGPLIFWSCFSLSVTMQQ